MSKQIEDLLHFFSKSPTAWHAVEEISQTLRKNGFQELKAGKHWALKPEGCYFVTRNDSSLIAFILPKENIRHASIVASHLDSPGLRLKPYAEIKKDNLILLGTEVYGGPLYNSWLNRDLGIAGRICFSDKKGNQKRKLVSIEDAPLVIPQLAIHLDRGVNEKGVILNPQKHLNAIAAMAFSKKGSYLDHLLKSRLQAQKIYNHELFLYPIEEPRLLGADQELVASSRIDNLISAHAALTGFLHLEKRMKNSLQCVVFWDNEEIGSSTAQGAASSFLTHSLERVILETHGNRLDYLKLLDNSFCVSVDGAHAKHPNYVEATEDLHTPLLGEGLVLKTDAQGAYASRGDVTASLIALCEKNHLNYQRYLRRTDVRAGTSLGPISETQSGIQMADIGCAQLSMHGIRELAACCDYIDLCKLLEKILMSNLHAS